MFLELLIEEFFQKQFLFQILLPVLEASCSGSLLESSPG